MITKFKLLTLVYAGLLSVLPALGNINEDGTAKVTPYFATCSAMIDEEYAVFVRFTEILSTQKQSWNVFAREYNPETGENYTLTQTIGQQTKASSPAHLRIVFDENHLEMLSQDIQDTESCFQANLNFDGDTFIKLKCAPYGIRIKCH